MLRLEILRLGRTIVKTTTCGAAVEKFKYRKCVCKFLSTDSVLKEVDSKNITKYPVSDRDDKEAVSDVLAANEFGLGAHFIKDVKKLWDASHNGSDLVLILTNCKALVEFGFVNNEILKIMKQCPNLFLTKTESINESLYLWSKWSVGDDLLLQFLVTNPMFILKNEQELKNRISRLLPYFQNDKSVCTLFINCPATIYENWSNLKVKLDFIHSHNIPMKFVAQCSGLNFNLRDIKTRFMFLERAGLYNQRIDLYKKDEKVQNPILNNILCPDDKHFAEKVAKLTLIEYEAFVDIYNAELDDLEEIIGSDGYESE